MKPLHTISLIIFSIAFSGCSHTSQTAQTLFTPDHYDPPVLYIDDESKKNDMIIESSNGRDFKLNTSNEEVENFKKREAMDNKKFIQIAYLYLMAAESQCERRVANINRSRSASNSGFGLLTTLSAVAGTAIGNTSGANAASGAAAVFNSLTTNANAFQNQIAAQYSGNIATVIVKKQSEMVEGVKSPFGIADSSSIKANLDKLYEDKAKPRNIALQSKIHHDLQKLNRVCTVSAGQREIGEKLSN